MSDSIQLIEKVTNKIISKYDLDRNKAEAFAKDLVTQIEAHGGNPENEAQMDKSIDIVVRQWLEKNY